MDERWWRGPRERTAAQDAAGPVAATPEFPPGADEPPGGVGRRGLLRVLGASAALAGASACSRGPRRQIVPYVDDPEGTPSVPAFYATTMSLGGYGIGLTVRSNDGRPTKAEGNARHPASGGALGVFEQASILSLYDPSRARAVTRGGVPASWRAFVETFSRPAPRGRRVQVLLEPTSSPHLVAAIGRARDRGDVDVHFDSPLSRENAWRGAELAFGAVLEPRCDLSRADVVLSLDSDFLGADGSPLPWARAWADRRRSPHAGAPMNRLYVAGPRSTVTAMSGDHRLLVSGRKVAGVAADVLAALLGTPDTGAPAPVRDAARRRGPTENARWAAEVARDLLAHRGSSLVLAGDGQPPEVHVLAHAMNALLGAVGRTVTYGPSPIFEAGEPSHGLLGLIRAIDAGEAAALLVLGGDPVFTAPADLDLVRRFGSVPASMVLGLHETETARRCAWFVPEAHFLECWGDARAFDGTASLAQPLMDPLFEVKTPAQVLAALVGAGDITSRELVEQTWRGRATGDPQAYWNRALVQGVADDGAAPAVRATLDWNAVTRALATLPAAPEALEVVYFADGKVGDGRFAENAWLQELPDPVTKLTWDNAALVSPATGTRLGVDSEDVVELSVRGRTVTAPVLVVPGMADDVVAIALGYGRTIPDRVSTGVGANAYAVRDSRAPWFDDVAVRKLRRRWPLAVTQEHWSMEGRPIALHRTLDEFRRDPDFARPLNEPPPHLYFLPPHGARESQQWGMTVDLGACTGCSACVVACMAENNVPVVGKAGVRLSREMHWLRIDRYYAGDPRDPDVVVQPMLCQHCEAAPCEYVCPVNATVHSSDGLNEMVYNRCVGTRFCSNNGPYKVRRFNFFNYHADTAPILRLAANPDVTVRARGVMEKCTYCVQRIKEAQIVARREQRPIRDGEVVTACQATCPTGAIVFGDLADPGTRVSRTRTDPRLYAVLHDLGTRPRTRYLARITNPNPALG
ncbi:MAG: 4Fe-4S dicluster domain-containing protein, partial [Myxococcales bacterium]|nr:4Fe-4S dicluster domain-containing protein [Myxococcales bacterium]